MKITPLIIQKVVRQKFENEKTEMFKISFFPGRSLGHVKFYVKTLSKGSKLDQTQRVFGFQKT